MAPTLAERVNAAVDMLNDENFTDCAAIMESMLHDHEFPRYHRIKCRILLAGTCDDWYDAENQRAAAESLWNTYCHVWPPGIDSDVDRALDDLRISLDDLKAA